MQSPNAPILWQPHPVWGPWERGWGSDLHGYWVAFGVSRSKDKGKQIDPHQLDTEGVCCQYKASRQPLERVSHGTSAIP